MPERTVQVDATAHGKVLGLAEVLGSTRMTAASLLIAVADEEAAIERHHADVRERLAARSSGGKAPGPGAVAAQPDAGVAGRDQQARGPGTAGARAAVQPATGRPVK